MGSEGIQITIPGEPARNCTQLTFTHRRKTSMRTTFRPPQYHLVAVGHLALGVHPTPGSSPLPFLPQLQRNEAPLAHTPEVILSPLKTLFLNMSLASPLPMFPSPLLARPTLRYQAQLPVQEQLRLHLRSARKHPLRLSETHSSPAQKTMPTHLLSQVLNTIKLIPS